jgi:hypothetical protein
MISLSQLPGVRPCEEHGHREANQDHQPRNDGAMESQIELGQRRHYRNPSAGLRPARCSPHSARLIGFPVPLRAKPSEPRRPGRRRLWAARVLDSCSPMVRLVRQRQTLVIRCHGRDRQRASNDWARMPRPRTLDQSPWPPLSALDIGARVECADIIGQVTRPSLKWH